MNVRWVDGFELAVEVLDGTVTISANREGLLSLAGILTAMAKEPGRTHIHLDENNSLEDGSAELIIDRTA